MPSPFRHSASRPAGRCPTGVDHDSEGRPGHTGPVRPRITDDQGLARCDGGGPQARSRGPATGQIAEGRLVVKRATAFCCDARKASRQSAGVRPGRWPATASQKRVPWRLSSSVEGSRAPLATRVRARRSPWEWSGGQ